MKRLPVEFLDKMQQLLHDEYEPFLASYDDGVNCGIRVNTLKVEVDDFRRLSSFALEPIPWAPGGFYYDPAQRPAKHPYYHAGLYYLQEPSAMAPGAVARATPGERILDLCAAPGGKSTQLAAGLAGRGVLVSNDVDGDRAKALTKNLELFGVRNAMVTSDTPQALARVFARWFDTVLIDAPCSGEGMFRKDSAAAKSWQSFGCARCNAMQKEILFHAVDMVRVGGRIVYSTCTFAPEENEQTLDWFLDTFAGWELEAVPRSPGFSSGRPEWGSGRPELSRAARLWPHKLRGEGHFVAILRRTEGVEQGLDQSPGTSEHHTSRRGRRSRVPVATVRDAPVLLHELPKCLDDFGRDFLTSAGTEEVITANASRFVERRGNLYILPDGRDGVLMHALEALNVLRPGWFVGLIRKERFEPSTALATALRPDMTQSSIDLPSGEGDVIRYLKCETLSAQGPKGWVLISTDGFSLGWAKQSDGVLKNYYPSWWRWSG